MQGRYSSSFFERLGVIFVLYQCTYDKYTLRLIVSVLVFRVTIMAVNDLSFFGRRAGRLYSSYFSSSADDIRANNMLVSLWLHNMTFFRFLLRIQLLFLAASVSFSFSFCASLQSGMSFWSLWMKALTMSAAFRCIRWSMVWYYLVS